MVSTRRVKMHFYSMNLAWREAQGAGELGDRLEQPTSNNVDGFAMPPQGRDRLDRSADHFLDVTFGEPCERRFIGTDNVEAFAVDFWGMMATCQSGATPDLCPENERRPVVFPEFRS